MTSAERLRDLLETATNPVGLQLAYKTIVIGVRADPEPDHRIVVEHAECAVAESNARRVDRSLRVHALEMQAGMMRIETKKAVGYSGLPPNVVW